MLKRLKPLDIIYELRLASCRRPGARKKIEEIEGQRLAARGGEAVRREECNQLQVAIKQERRPEDAADEQRAPVDPARLAHEVEGTAQLQAFAGGERRGAAHRCEEQKEQRREAELHPSQHLDGRHQRRREPGEEEDLALAAVEAALHPEE